MSIEFSSEQSVGVHEFEKAFPEPPAKTKKTKTEEETLLEFIKETYPNGVPLYSRTKYHSIRDEEDVLKDAAMLSGNISTDPRFRKKFARLRKRWHEECMHAKSANTPM
jgi:hypothetical protein